MAKYERLAETLNEHAILLNCAKILSIQIDFRFNGLGNDYKRLKQPKKNVCGLVTSERIGQLHKIAVPNGKCFVGDSEPGGMCGSLFYLIPVCQLNQDALTQ